jgi:hypothetical protein
MYGKEEKRKWRNSSRTSRKSNSITAIEKKKKKENVC